MTATGEEAVVGKTARVVEEVVVSKTAEEHVENVDDTVRRTDVEVERDNDADTTTGSGVGTNRDRY
jgi:stress response protein YsnF